MTGPRAFCEVRGDGMLAAAGRRPVGSGEAEALRRWVLQQALRLRLRRRRVPDGVTVLAFAAPPAEAVLAWSGSRRQARRWHARVHLDQPVDADEVQHAQHRRGRDGQPYGRLAGGGPPRGPHDGGDAGRVAGSRRGHVHHKTECPRVKRGQEGVSRRLSALVRSISPDAVTTAVRPDHVAGKRSSDTTTTATSQAEGGPRLRTRAQRSPCDAGPQAALSRSAASAQPEECYYLVSSSACG